MSDLSGQSASAGIDLTQFYQVFFEEAGENLDVFEHKLLGLDIVSADDEELNAIFRCAHSVKGGAATFGFSDVAELTHEMESLLDKLRRHELQPTASMVDVLLASSDALKAQLARHQGKGTAPVDTGDLLRVMRGLATGQSTLPFATPLPAMPLAAAPAALPAAPTHDEVPHGARQLELRLGPLPDLSQADGLVELFSEIRELGAIEALDAGRDADGVRRFKVTTESADSELIDLFSFHVAREHIALRPLADSMPGYGFFDGAPGAPDAPDASIDEVAAPATAPAAATIAPNAAAHPNRPAVGGESSTLRVSVEKVDQLINLVGELVITQAMLAQNGKTLDGALHAQLSSGLADLERNTRDLQEAVMSIRMIPMSVVFNRFPRTLRDLATKLGKKVDLVTQGDATELDKGLVERITDPLTHLVRNSCDHGIESPADRLALGKPETGTISLIASHQGGSVVIEVRDDGKGLSRAKLLATARQRGIEADDAMSDAEVWNLIFAPGFSTATEVTDVSGRGVGMDVVKKNITALGGRVEIDSAEGYGMTVRVRLPLTLAIMDGMSVGVGDECYILPLSSVVESFQVRANTIRSIAGNGRVVQVRDEYMPVLDIERVFEVPEGRAERRNDIMVVVEADGARVALLVHELLGQQQVVVKNLESNYRKVDDVSGATIMGDGRVALILDVNSLVRRSRH